MALFEFSEDVFEKARKVAKEKTPEEIEKEREQTIKEYYEKLLEKMATLIMTKEDCEVIMG